jgi:tRNA(fMet)-specific endonuclease VapC
VKYVLDTNAVSSLMRAEPAIIARLKSIARTDVALPQPVAAEIEYGLARLPTSKRKQVLEERWHLFSRELPRLAWTDEVSVEFGRVKASLEKRGQRIEDFDVAIAAHALAFGATLVTANVKHMLRVARLAIEDWSKG